MRELGTIRSLIESHRAEATRPDRRSFLPQTGRLPSAAHFSALYQLDCFGGASVLASRLVSSLAAPNYEASSPRRHRPSSMGLRLSPFAWRRSPVNAPVPTGGKAVPNGPADAPNFSAVFPIAPKIFPNFPATFPNFSPADLIYNGLFHSNLCEFQALNRQIHN